MKTKPETQGTTESTPRRCAPVSGSAANTLIAEMLDALEHAQGELTSGWIEPMSIVLVLKQKIYPAIRNARKYLKQQNDPAETRRKEDSK